MKESFRITVIDQGDAGDAPASVRFRRLLKLMLRVFGFRCLDLEPVPTDDGRQRKKDNGA